MCHKLATKRNVVVRKFSAWPSSLVRTFTRLTSMYWRTSRTDSDQASAKSTILSVRPCANLASNIYGNYPGSSIDPSCFGSSWHHLVSLKQNITMLLNQERPIFFFFPFYPPARTNGQEGNYYQTIILLVLTLVQDY